MAGFLGNVRNKVARFFFGGRVNNDNNKLGATGAGIFLEKSGIKFSIQCYLSIIHLDHSNPSLNIC